MTISYTYNGSAVTHKIAPSLINIPSRAEGGDCAFGGIPIEDPTGTLTIVGHKPFVVEESACSQPRLFTGWTTERGIGRSLERGMFVGDDAALHDTTIVDLNALFGFRILSGSDAKRPEETIADRLAWLLGSDYLDGLIEDTGYVGTAWTSSMDEADYTGSFPSDVMNDLVARTGDRLSYFAFWDADADAVGLFWNTLDAPAYTSTLTISNDPADIDNDTCFAPSIDAQLKRAPDQTYSEVMVEYGDGQRVFRRRPATATNFIRRGTSISRPYTRRKTTAQSQADAWLTRHSVEEDRITVTIQVPRDTVGLVTAGQRIDVKFTHMPDYRTWTSMRVVTYQPTPTNDVADFYDIALELIAPRAGGSSSAPGIEQWAWNGAVTNYPYDVALPHALGAGDLLVAFVGSTGARPAHAFDVDAIEGTGWTKQESGYGYDAGQYGGPGSEVMLNIYTRTVLPGDDNTITVQPGVERSWTYIFEMTGVTEADIIDIVEESTSIVPNVAHSVTATGTGFLLGGWIWQRTDYAPEDSVTTSVGTEIVDWQPTALGFGAPGLWLASASGTNPVITGTMPTNPNLNYWGIYAFGLLFDETLDEQADAGNALGTPVVATTDPTVNDDANDGYTVGQLWVNETTGDVFVLTDSTPGAAVWTPTGGGGGAMPWYDVTVDGGCAGDGVTDDTSAIQAAIDDATANGTQSATLYFPPGTYLIGGALQDTGAFNGQILFPDVSHSAQPTVSITLVGAMRPPMHPLYGASLPAEGHTVLKSTLTGATGTAAVFSGGNRSISFANGNNLTVNLRNLTLLVPDNPTLSGFNLGNCQGGDLRSVQVSSPGGFTGSLSEPTHSNSYGIKLPSKYWSNSTVLYDVSVGSTYTCILMGELTRLYGGIFGNCKVVLEFPDVFYPSEVHGMTSTNFAVGLKGTGAHGITITNYIAEHYDGSDWRTTTYDLDDASDYLFGTIEYLCRETGGTLDTFNVNGAANVDYWEIGSLPTGGTPATTVEDETTWGIAPAVGTDTEYARQDHTHGTPAAPSGELLVADGTAGPSGIVPTSYVEMTTPDTTTSGTLEDLTGATTTITLHRTSHVAAWLNCHVSATATCDYGIAINFDGTDHDEIPTHLTATDEGGVAVVHRTVTELPPGTYTVKGRHRRISGGGTPQTDRADLLVMAMGQSGPVILTNDAEDDYLYADV